MISFMRHFKPARFALGAASLFIIHSAAPALAVEKAWQDGNQVAAAGTLGQSDWVKPGGASGVDSFGSSLGQSEWVSPQSSSMRSNGTAIGQSDWMSPHSSSTRSTGGSLGQSDWIGPNHAVAGQTAGSIGQSGWVRPGTTGAVKGRAGTGMSAPEMGQSDWMRSSGSAYGQSELVCPATVSPRGIAQDHSPQLRGQVSASDLYPIGAGTDMSYLGDGMSDPGQIGMGDMSAMSPMPATSAGQPQSMEEMIGSIMMIPMSLAASSGFIGQGFRTYGPGGGGGGFRTYGPGGGGGGSVVGGGLIGGTIGDIVNTEARTARRYVRHYTQRALNRAIAGSLSRR